MLKSTFSGEVMIFAKQYDKHIGPADFCSAGERK